MFYDERHYFRRLEEIILPSLDAGWEIMLNTYFDSKESYKADKPQSAKVEIITDYRYWTFRIMLDNVLLTEGWKERWGPAWGTGTAEERANEEGVWSNIFELREPYQTNPGSYRPKPRTVVAVLKALADRGTLFLNLKDAAEAVHFFVGDMGPLDHVPEIEKVISLLRECEVMIYGSPSSFYRRMRLEEGAK